ncbi:MAG TPA: MmgE/PrpD family protein [Candidatus Binatia bacterium]|nr:MmgE/PrpD family protein [Candidatus Binatia bacterium]
MTTTERLAAFVASLDPSTAGPSLLDAVRMHVFDTIGAACAGARVADTPPVRELVTSLGPRDPALALGQGLRTTLPLAALLGCVATRCTEIDDIHIGSCTTPGSVVVPAAIAAASAENSGDDRRFLAACLAGFEVLVRFGLAIDGAHILYKGIWPTYLAAGFGTAATVGKIAGLSAEQLAHAFAIVATMATGTVGGRAPGLTSRWFILGSAVQSAVMAALAAGRGMQGDLTLLDGRWSEITGVALDGERLVDGLGTRFHASEISFKPICSAKQAIAAVYAMRFLLENERINAGDIRHVLVEVPTAYAKMIDQPDLPKSRLASITNVRYQLALAAFAPETLNDPVRDQLPASDDISAFTKKVDVRADAALDTTYPESWPARVTLTLASGSQAVKELQRAPGDPGSGYGWSAVEAKYSGSAPEIATACKRLGERGTLSALLSALETTERPESRAASRPRSR